MLGAAAFPHNIIGQAFKAQAAHAFMNPTLTTSLRACSSSWVTCPKGVGDGEKQQVSGPK